MTDYNEGAPLNDEELKNLEEMISKMSHDYNHVSPQPQQYGIQEVTGTESSTPPQPTKTRRGKRNMTPARLEQLAKARSVFLENVKKRKTAEQIQFQEYKKVKRQEEMEKEYEMMKRAEELAKIESKREEEKKEFLEKKRLQKIEVEQDYIEEEEEPSYFSGFFMNVLKMAAIGGAVLVLKAYAPEQIVEQKAPNKS